MRSATLCYEECKGQPHIDLAIAAMGRTSIGSLASVNEGTTLHSKWSVSPTAASDGSRERLQSPPLKIGSELALESFHRLDIFVLQLEIHSCVPRSVHVVNRAKSGMPSCSHIIVINSRQPRLRLKSDRIVVQRLLNGIDATSLTHCSPCHVVDLERLVVIRIT
jgi:hypothetical protein